MHLLLFCMCRAIVLIGSHQSISILIISIGQSSLSIRLIFSNKRNFIVAFIQKTRNI